MTVNYWILALAFTVAAGISFLMTPPVKKFACIIGAVDVPRDNRRMHDHPIPRLGGLAIFIAFLAGILLFGKTDKAMASILIGALIVVTLGVLDDILRLKALPKFLVQIVAALIPVLYGGLRIQALTNFNLFSGLPYTQLGVFSIPITVLWIVGITNAVNFIDGLDGLAAGVSAISALTMLVISCALGNATLALTMAVLFGSVLGFLPYNLNPAKIFMGDTGATFLGFILATMSIQGLFKMYALVSFAVPFLVLGLPLFDLVFSVFRRILSGHSPMESDRGHVHHRLIDMGFNVKQAVAILYAVTAILGVFAVVLATSGGMKATLVVLAAMLAICLSIVIIKPVFGRRNKQKAPEPPKADGEAR